MPDNAPKPATPGSTAYRDVEPDQLVRENISWMLALAERILRDRSYAEDAVQDAFLSSFKALPHFKGQSSLKTWLHRITVNASLSALRRLKRQSEHSIDDLLPQFDQQDCRIEEPWVQLTTVQEVMESADLGKRVQDGINSLPDSYRVILQLRDIDGYATGDVADLLDIKEANVKVRLHRARAALKKLLEPVLRGETDQ